MRSGPIWKLECMKILPFLRWEIELIPIKFLCDSFEINVFQIDP